MYASHTGCRAQESTERLSALSSERQRSCNPRPQYPIAKIVPFPGDDMEDEERTLVTQGLIKLPAKAFDLEKFFAIGRNVKTGRATKAAVNAALDWSREDLDVSFLGRKRRPPPVRTRAKK